MRTNFKKFFVVLFLFVISMVHAQFERNYDYFDDAQEEKTFESLSDNMGFFSSGDEVDPYDGNPGDIITYATLEMGNGPSPIDDYILPMLVIGIGLGMYYKKQWIRS